VSAATDSEFILLFLNKLQISDAVENVLITISRIECFGQQALKHKGLYFALKYYLEETDFVLNAYSHLKSFDNIPMKMVKNLQNIESDFQYLADMARELMDLVDASNSDASENPIEVEPFDAKQLLHHPMAGMFWVKHFGRNVFEVPWLKFRW
jgi:hypothetical protein